MRGRIWSAVQDCLGEGFEGPFSWIAGLHTEFLENSFDVDLLRDGNFSECTFTSNIHAEEASNMAEGT